MHPVVLGIDTSGSWCSAALSSHGRVFVRRAEVGHAHSDHLLRMVGDVLDEAGLGLAECDALAFAAGPGLFTGLRVGCAVAQGLAYGARLQVAPIGTLTAIARSVDDLDPMRPTTVLVAQDARMGEIYWSLIERRDDVLRTLVGPSLASPDALRAALRDRPQIDLGCGNAWAVHPRSLDGLVPRVVLRESADAVDVTALGVVEAACGRLLPPEAARPVYVRDDVARTTAERAAARLAAAA